ncbi:restriction endonuclease subunit S [Stutzerimonas chloritidismutans]
MLANWADCKLGDVASIIRGVTFPASSKVHEPADGYVACLRTSHVQEKLLWENIYYVPENYVKRADQLVGKNDILMSMANSSNLVGKVCINETDRTACFGAFLSAIRSKEIDHRYVYYYLKSSEAQRALKASASQTVNIANISVGALENLRVPLPPLAEQTRIAAKLDELLAQVDTLKARIDGIPALLKSFRQSVLAAAVSGRLTEEWQASAAVDWSFQRAADVCEKVQSGGTPKEGFSESGVPFLKVYNIVNQEISFEYRPQYISESIHRGASSKSITMPGDVVMNIVGPPLGKVATIPATSPEWNINQAITLFRPSENIISGWISIVLLGGENLRSIINETKGSAGQVNISLSQCRDFLFPVPCVEEQTEIVRRVEQLFAFADQLEARVKAAQARIDRLTQSILAKAFSGELVPQDPNDEQASVLLERIKAQRAAEPKAKRGRKASA